MGPLRGSATPVSTAASLLPTLPEVPLVNSFEQPSRPSRSDPATRRADYVLWRRRIADKQEEVRSYGEPAPEHVVDPRWSADALFRATPGAGVRPAQHGPEVADASQAADGRDRPSTPSGRPDHIDLVGDARHESTLDPATKRRELEEQLRRIRATTRSRRAIGAAGPQAGPTGFSDDRSPDRRRTPVALEDGGRSAGGHDGPVTAPSTISEELRELNRLRVEGELTDVEFKLRKHDLFVRTSTRPRPSA